MRAFNALRGDPQPEYDTVVIGAGIGGLICAALLAREGLRVLRHDVGQLGRGQLPVGLGIVQPLPQRHRAPQAVGDAGRPRQQGEPSRPAPRTSP